MSTAAKVMIGVCGVLLLGLLLMLNLYGGLKDNYQLLSTQFIEQVAINKDYKSRIQSLHELDTMYTQELTNAKTEIDSLRDAVKSGAKRVYIKAECPRTGTDTAAGMDDGRPATLARDAEQDYFHLRKQLETLEKQYLGLRDYVITECQK
ncbi:lysis protein [Morganella psychrotolerans]|uniref:Lysozyme n=1 Tax=Morganella psychrotolerans TaxID=368603 RepID=A0A1B8HQE5_9GAMM|nr:lysis protein [Morganella psychrotolerans]OBU11709.1 lysozyme [Morganella psychrotolerans]